MCLATPTIIPYIINTDIICYKILITTKEGLKSPYMEFIFPLRQIMVDQVEAEPVNTFGLYIIEKGYFHSYQTKEAARNKIRQLSRRMPKNQILKVYKASIPAGTEFFKGQYEDLCSKSLQILEECFD